MLELKIPPSSCTAENTVGLQHLLCDKSFSVHSVAHPSVAEGGPHRLRLLVGISGKKKREERCAPDTVLDGTITVSEGSAES